MKKYLLILLLAPITLSTTPILAQNFEGKITFSITYEDIPLEMEGYESMMPKEMTIKLKGSNSRMEQSMSMGSTVNIYNGNDKENYTLFDMAEKKIAIKMTEDEIDKEKSAAPTPKITYLKETKKIAGYTCKKVEIKMTDSSETTTVFYTDKIQTEETTEQFKGLKGFPMQYEVYNQGIKTIMTATVVTKEDISNSEFTVPSEYIEMTLLEFQQEIQNQLMEGQ